MRQAELAGIFKAATLTLCLCGLPLFASPPEAASQRSHRLKLGSFVVPPNPTSGLLIRARINGGPLLRLLLDSGTQYVVLDRKAAARSSCVAGGALDLVGAGGPAAATARTVAGNTIEIADLTLRNIPLLVTDHRVADGIDGALPLSLFDGFLIELDLAGHTLDLVPYPDGPAYIAGAAKAVASNRLLFLKGVFDERHEGYFLLDTGASYNAVARGLGRYLSRSDALTPRVSVKGATAAGDAPLFPETVRVQFGSYTLEAGPVVAIDLATASRYHAFEVAGLIGYPALRDSILIVDYRDQLVWIGPR